MNYKLLIVGAATILTVGAGTAVYAKNKIGEVTGPGGLAREKVEFTGEVVDTNKDGKNRIVIKEGDKNQYIVNLGPRWYKNNSLDKGENIKVQAVQNKNGTYNAFKIIKANGEEVVMREKLGKPAWPGAKKMERRINQKRSGNFIDVNKDGICDNK